MVSPVSLVPGEVGVVSKATSPIAPVVPAPVVEPAISTIVEIASLIASLIHFSKIDLKSENHYASVRENLSALTDFLMIKLGSIQDNITKIFLIDIKPIILQSHVT